jgi:hypothetical protein
MFIDRDSATVRRSTDRQFSPSTDLQRHRLSLHCTDTYKRKIIKILFEKHFAPGGDPLPPETKPA